MAKIGFVACSKTKSARKLPAAALYTSALFRKSLLAAIDRSEKVYILSAKHGLLGCDDMIEPYDTTLKTMARSERALWGTRTGAQLASVLRPQDTAVLLCGEEYLTPLQPELERINVALETPLGSLSLGSRLSYLKELNGEYELRATANRFFKLMQEVWAAQGGGRRIELTNGRQDWPKRGVYFILSAHSLGRARMPRIVRVGTHAVSQGSKTTLWNRLSTHRGTEAGSGSHRSSIFRLHVGRAWARYAADKCWPETWAQGQSAPLKIRQGEQMLEQQVSRLIGAMNVIWLDVDDEAGPKSERAYIERNVIGLLSRIGLLQNIAEPDWLGHFSADWRIASTGLWNLNYIFYRPDPDFIDRITVAVQKTIGRLPHIQKAGVNASNSHEQPSFLPGWSKE